ncbi:MAG: acyl-CoA dehydrogenase [Candidatus Eremiobacteraeota bacterium]|nr:acyl-CoA dehydrogenase [Candidatus Eremiobacteraeota bacterium]
MEFTLNEEQRMLQDMVREFAQEKIAPKAAEHDAACTFPSENIKAMAELGLMGVTIPDEYGGAGMDTLSYCIAIEEIARACASTAVIMAVHNSLIGNVIYTFGTDGQKKKYLADVASGKKLGAYALTEPNAGSDAAHIETLVRKEGDHYILDGTKTFITSSVAADLFIVYGTMDRSLGSRGICCFIVERDTPGFKVGKKEEMMGMRASGTSQLIFEGCRVPAENLVGAECEGFKVCMGALDVGRLGIAAQAVGISQAAFDASLRYSQERKQFGQPICNFQMVQAMLVQMATETEAARLMVYRTAWLKDQGESFSKEASMAKLFASDTAVRTTINAVQVHGGYGYTKEYPLERYLRDAKVTQIYEGTSEVQKLVIARQLLKK